MATRSFGTAATALVLAAVLVSCSDEDPSGSDEGGLPPIGTPTGAPPGSEPAQALPHSGAPKVASPIADTSRWEGDPCSLLSAQQIEAAGLKPTEPQREDQPTGPGCFWEFDPDTASGFSAGFGTTGGRQGISNLYKHKEQGTAKVFEELPPIEGHPAVVALPEDTRGDGECNVGVGVRDDLLFDVTMTADPSTPQGKDPCGWAARVAALAVQTMKGSS